MSVSAFQMTYELSPIVLTNGIAANMPGGALPIISLTQASDFNQGITSGSDALTFDDFFAHFEPLPGSTLAEFEYGQYPFANQSVAANAAIVQPLVISMLMKCPAFGDGGYSVKQATMTALQQAITQHGMSGGTYSVATPSYIWTNALLKVLRDAGGEGDDKQVQTHWIWDFWVPLLTVAQATAAQNALMSKISNGSRLDGTDGAVAWSGLQQTTGAPGSVQAPVVIPGAGGSGAAGVGAPQGPPG
jgi:hypothetical protein